MTEYLLGYDVRLIEPAVLAREWREPRRELYLLSPSVEWVASVDRIVWPSLFDFSEEASSTSLDVLRLPPTSVHEIAFGLWRDCGAMSEAAARWRHWRKMQTASIAISVVDIGAVSGDRSWELAQAEGTVANEASWTLLGYDVADRSLLSGLSNCGYLEEERGTLRSTWSSKVNAVGLFDDLAEAFAYCAVTEQRVAEHAPFLVYGVHRLND